MHTQRTISCKLGEVRYAAMMFRFVSTHKVIDWYLI